MTTLEALADAITDALNSNKVADVLAILAGSLVGLTTELVRRQGENPDKEITLNGGESRDITIHAKKAGVE